MPMIWTVPNIPYPNEFVNIVAHWISPYNFHKNGARLPNNIEQDKVSNERIKAYELWNWPRMGCFK